jgi:hypothetical protein
VLTINITKKFIEHNTYHTWQKDGPQKKDEGRRCVQPTLVVDAHSSGSFV